MSFLFPTALALCMRKCAAFNCAFGTTLVIPLKKKTTKHKMILKLILVKLFVISALVDSKKANISSFISDKTLDNLLVLVSVTGVFRFK